MNYYSDYFSKVPHKQERARQFDTWWDENKTRIEQNNLHSFSGLIRNNLQRDYYYSYWNLIVNGIRLGVNL